MNVFIFKDVLHDYTAGMAVIVAENLTRAKQMAFDEFSYHDDTMAVFLDKEYGFKVPVASLPTTETIEHMHFVYGGG